MQICAKTYLQPGKYVNRQTDPHSAYTTINTVNTVQYSVIHHYEQYIPYVGARVIVIVILLFYCYRWLGEKSDCFWN